MAIDDNGLLIAAGVAGLIFGLILGRVTGGASGQKKSNQRITENEIGRWKIDPDWSEMLMSKNPIEKATTEYNKLMKQKESNDKEDAIMARECRERLEKIEEIKAELVTLEDTPLSVAYLREIGLAPVMAKMTRLRKKSEKIVSVDLRYAHHEHFLFLVKSGSRKPGLIEEMDNSIIDVENDRPHTKTLKFMERQVAGLQDDEDSINRVNAALGM